ncbi:MAG TPA: DNA polymerase III subunit delta [Candidatus Limnocylindria bacterium]
MSVALLLVHGDDDFGIGESLTAFAERIQVAERTEITPERSPDEAAIDRARLESATVGMFGAHLVVLHQPIIAAGRSNAATDKLLALVSDLPDGAALALAELRPSRDSGKPPALLQRIAQAVTDRDGTVEERETPRRNQLQGWIRAHADAVGVRIEPRAAALLAERVGGAVWESDIERGQQTRVADGELRKLATYAGDRAIGVEDVEALVTDTRPSSLFAITNAIDRREPAAAAAAIERAIGEGQPVLRILAALEGRIADLIVARDLGANGAPPQELTKRVGRGNARMAERIAESARRYSGAELEAMLRGLFEADLSIKANEMAEEPALVAWLGEYLLATRPTRG